MTINFFPNDPTAGNDMPMRTQAARADRPASRADFNFVTHQAEGAFDFDTLDFLFWQSREAALATLEAWEAYAGNLSRWADRSSDPRRIDLTVIHQDPTVRGPRRLNAYYDGTGVRFFDFNDGAGTTTFSAASTDTVSHEVGHALLDSQRPELFGSNVPEIGAFHEAFGDMVAILTALADRDTRVKLLEDTSDLSEPNFVEAGQEYLTAAVRKQFGDVSPSQPRRALNQFKWQLPSTLPAGDFRDPPDTLSRESHNFSRVFTGAFYDTLRAVFTAGESDDEAALAKAAVTVGTLLVEAVRNTPETPRYFQAIGRGMVKADEQLNGGANREPIGKAFSDHGLMLGSAAMTAPTAALAGPAPTVEASTAALAGPATAVEASTAKVAASTLADLRERIGAKKGARFAVRALSMLGDGVVEAVHRREVSLGSIHRSLRGVIAYAAEPILVGSSGGRAAVLGSLPEQTRTEDEVGAFVETLLAHGRIALAGLKEAAADIANSTDVPTHVIRTISGKKVLTRTRFLCGCCGGPATRFRAAAARRR